MYHSHNSPKQKKIDKTGDKEYLANYSFKGVNTDHARGLVP